MRETGRGAAAGVGALPLVDLVGVPAVQAKLLHTLAKLYGQSWDRRSVSEFLGLLGASVGVAYVARLLGRESDKLIRGGGQTVGAVWGASAGGATTFALGKAAGYYFARRREGRAVDPARLRQIYADALVAGANILKSKPGSPSS